MSLSLVSGSKIFASANGSIDPPVSCSGIQIASSIFTFLFYFMQLADSISHGSAIKSNATLR
jgi:hypothetical protein